MTWKTPAVQAEVNYLLSLLPLSHEAATCNAPGLRIQIALSEKPCVISKAWTAHSTAYGLTIVETAEGCAVHDGASIFEIDSKAGRARIGLHPSFRNKALPAKSDFFLVGTFHALLARGYFDLHAAGLVREKVGYLLIGESGSGKSTAAVNLVYRGWHYLSDDTVLLRLRSQGVQAFGFRRHFYLDVSTNRHWSRIIPSCIPTLEQPTLPKHCKQFVDLEQVYPGRLRNNMLPQLLIFLRILPSSESRLAPLNQTSALVRLLRQSASLSFNRKFAREHLDLLSRLVTQTQHYELLAGQDVLDDPSRLDELLSGISPTKDRVPRASRLGAGTEK